MAKGDVSLSREGRLHHNYAAMHHRELLTPGPVAAMLRIRLSPYHKLASCSSRRPTDYTTLESHAGSIQVVQPSVELDSIHPGQALEVVDRHLSDDESVNEQSAVCPGFDIEKSTAVRHGSKIGTENEDLPVAALNDLMQRATDSERCISIKTEAPEDTFGISGDETSSERVLRLRTKPADRLPSQSTKATSGRAKSVLDESEDQHIFDEGTLPGHLCIGACEHPGCDLGAELEALGSSLFPDHKRMGDNRLEMPGKSTLLLYDYLTSFKAPNNNRNQPTYFPTAENSEAHLLQPYQHPLMSVREMAITSYPQVDNHVQNPHRQNDPAATTGEFRAARNSSKVYVKQDECVSEAALLATVPVAPPVSPTANGRVWESRATRRERRRQEVELRNSPSTAALPMTSPSTETYHASSTGVRLDGASTSPNVPKDFTPTSNSFQMSSTSRPPRRFQNQDTNCLVCLQPVTPSNLLIADLRCVACPRIFHGPCLTYIPPSMNQNWRCSLCYKEGWHGYGHVPAERDVDNPSLVERYRRRLLLAKTYGDFNAGSDNVRFWFEVDMDGGFESDQMVFVRMGMANEYKLRLVGHGRAKTVEEMERWGIALGMRLQEEEGKVENLQMEVETLKAALGEKEREIAELESGL